MFAVVIPLAILALMIVSMWKIFEKAGQPGWACIIPIYNYIVLLEIVRKPWWFLLLMLIPIVNIVIAIWVVNRLSKSFGYDAGFTIGLILLGVVFYPILGLGSAEYKALEDDGAAPAAAPIPEPVPVVEAKESPAEAPQEEAAPDGETKE